MGGERVVCELGITKTYYEKLLTLSLPFPPLSRLPPPHLLNSQVQAVVLQARRVDA